MKRDALCDAMFHFSFYSPCFLCFKFWVPLNGMIVWKENHEWTTIVILCDWLFQPSLTEIKGVFDSIYFDRKSDFLIKKLNLEEKLK